MFDMIWKGFDMIVMLFGRDLEIIWMRFGRDLDVCVGMLYSVKIGWLGGCKFNISFTCSLGITF